jgi:hypothetical protein
MFYEGDLQSGIDKAIQESKLVACFVTGMSVPCPKRPVLRSDYMSVDEGKEGQTWENDFLEEPPVRSL